MEKILNIIEAMANEKGISIDSAIEAFKEAIIRTVKRIAGEDGKYEVEVDRDKQTYHIYRFLTVVSEDDDRLYDDPDHYISIEEAKVYDEDAEIGGYIKAEFHLEEYGRTAASNLFRELEYHIQRRIEQDLFEKYKSKVGSIIIGTVSRVDDDENTYVEIGEIKGILSQRNRIKGEKFKVGDTLKALLRFVSIDPKYGLHLELTRTSPKFLEELMRREVPEIQDGSVEIVASARIPGERAKIALKSDRADVDPVGAAVGQKGVRINAVSAELCNENIDCIEYSPIAEVFVTRALAPAVVKNVRIENKNTSKQKAIVQITKDQKAKAIGKSGINIRLASMLTKYQIELEEVEGISERPSGDSSAETPKTNDITALANLFK